MTMINETFNIFSVFDCRTIKDFHDNFQYNSLWRQNVMGCYMLNILKDFYKFNTSYILPSKSSNWTSGRAKKFLYNKSIDIYAFPMTLRQHDWDEVWPLQSIFTWKFGFLARRIDKEVFRRYYTEPFAKPLWRVLYFLCFFVPLLFYIQASWERRILGVDIECSFLNEFILAVGGYCQIVPPVDPRLNSRRLAYAVYFLFTFVIHSYFTSELLSHLVYKTDDVYDLNTLIDNKYEFAVLPDMQLILSQTVIDSSNLTLILPRLSHARLMDAEEGLKAVTHTRTALLSDYFTLYPLMKTMLTTETLCKLTQVDINSNIIKYFFTSKNFPYKEEFKISIIRAKEAGLVSNWDQDDIWYTTLCSSAAEVQASFTQIFYPFLTLWCTSVLATLIMMGERWWYYRNNKVLPYVE